MGGCADRTVIMRLVVQRMMMKCNCRVCDEKKKKYGKCKRNSFIYELARHGFNYNE